MVERYTKIIWNGWNDMIPMAGAIIHNDYGRMTVRQYAAWLAGRAPELGFAHKYTSRDTIGQFVPDDRSAYHAGDGHGKGNRYYKGHEVIQSRGPEFGDITIEEFIENENMVLRDVAEDFHKHGLQPNRETIKLHNQFANTSCPHLSQDIHGKGVLTQDYFIAKVKQYMALGKTVEEILAAEKRQVAGAVKEGTLYRVQVGAFEKKENAISLMKRLENAGQSVYLVRVGKWFKVQVGAYSVKENAERKQNELKGKQFDAFITTEVGIGVVGHGDQHTEDTSKETGITNKYAETGEFWMDDVIYVRDQPSTKGKIIATYHPGSSVKYHTVHWGNGYVWLQYDRNGGGQGYIPCRTYENNVFGEVWGSFNPPTKKKEYIYLPADNATWGVYPLNVQPVAKNIRWRLAPAVNGGLEYEVQYWAMEHVAVIQTEVFGKVQIYVGPDTNAKRYNK